MIEEADKIRDLTNGISLCLPTVCVIDYMKKKLNPDLNFHSIMAEEDTRFTILVFPRLAYSHVHPYFELAKHLSNKKIHIYFCSSAINLDSIRNKIEPGSSIDLIELHLPLLPELPPHLHTTKNLPPNLLPNLLHAFQQTPPAFSEILKIVSPDLLIYDFFQPWAAKQARALGIPSVYFATSGAAPFSYFHHLFVHGEDLPFPHEEIFLRDHEKVGVRAPVELVVKDADEDSFSFGVFDLSSDVVLMKGLRGFDGKYADYLSHLCGKKIIHTGPLVLEPADYHVDEESAEILQWLGEKERSSTVFVCFGSEHFISVDQILEISKGLELTRANFIWAVRFPPEAKGVSSIGEFLERERERGRVVEGWLPQAKILSHSSIGGFVSHCGWSSVMESLYFGVPIIAMPIKFDQPLNARVVVDAGVGAEVVRGGNGCFAAEEVAAAIDRVVVEESGEGMRRRAKDVREIMRREESAAVDETAEEILLLCKKSKHSSVD